jgi:hypothetical protein
MHKTQTLFLAFTTLGLATTARAQFSLPWFSIDGGGGTSAGGQFSVSGTIGQPDAGALSGGVFKLEGGFWSGIRVLQMPDAPVLKIQLTPGGLAIISWPLNANGFQLEETTTLAQANSWTPTLQPVVNTGTDHTVTVPAAAGYKCFRLKHVGP